MPPRRKKHVTERQNQAYEFIRDEIRIRKKPPTIKELQTHLGVKSPNAVWKLLQALEKKGKIVRDRQAARGIRLVDTEADPFAMDDQLPQLPLISRTSSAEPEKLRTNPNGFLLIDPYFLGDSHYEDCILCRAGDDGMYSDGFNKGDYLIVEELDIEAIRDGQVVACLVDETLLVRRFDFKNERIHLRPSEKSYLERTFPLDDPQCHVIGPVLSVIRPLNLSTRRRRTRRLR